MLQLFHEIPEGCKAKQVAGTLNPILSLSLRGIDTTAAPSANLNYRGLRPLFLQFHYWSQF